MNQPPSADEMDEAMATIARQADEIKFLQARLQREQFAEELRQLLTGFETSSVLLAPFTHSRLLEMVVQAALEIISAQSGSLFILDEEAKELVPEVVTGAQVQAVKQLRIPLGHGIAGMVAMSGQPIALAHAHEDPRLALDIARAIDYIPDSILCVPLFYEEHVIGVIELLDKKGASSFNAGDMGTLCIFSNIAAVAIEQSRAYHDQKSVLTALIHSFKEADPQERQRLAQNAAAFADWLSREHVANMKARRLALLVYELNSYGENEYDVCLNILQSFVTNLRGSQGKGYSFATGGNAQGGNI